MTPDVSTTVPPATPATTPAVTPVTTPAGSILVGVDGSPSSDRALRWATRTAELEHRPLTIVHCVAPSADGDAAGPGPGGRALLADAVRRVSHQAPGVAAYEVLSTQDPREELLTRAAQAAMVVVGSRGRGRVAGLLLGSVSVAVAQHAACPVAVVGRSRPGPDRRGVIVESDGGEESRPAVELAYRAASLRGLPLTVLHVSWADDARAERSRVWRTLDHLRARFPDVRTRLRLVAGARNTELILASHQMDLVVLSRRHRHHDLRDLLDLRPATGTLGDARAVLEESRCDVVVVPLGRSGTSDSGPVVAAGRVLTR